MATRTKRSPAETERRLLDTALDLDERVGAIVRTWRDAMAEPAAIERRVN